MEFYSFDGDYVRRLGEGDPFVEAHFTTYFCTLLLIKLRGSLRSRETIEDARQETFVRVLQTLRQKGGFEHPERLGSFVNTVCNHVVHEMLRGETRYSQMSGQAGDLPDQRIDLDMPLINQERKRLVERVLAELSKRDRELLQAVFLEETEKPEACRRLGVDQDYLRVLLHRAKSRFREKLTKPRASTA